MRLKFLLLFIGMASMVGAQNLWDSTLIITEASTAETTGFNNVYIEVTNVGDTPLDLSEFKFVKIGKGSSERNCDYLNGRWTYGDNDHFYLPESVTKILQPGESYVMTVGLDFGLNGYNMGLYDFAFQDRAKNHDIYQYADFIAHREEKNDEEALLYPNVKDSAIYSPDSALDNNDYVFTLGHNWLDHNGFFIEHHYTNELGQPDSIVIDQIKCTFSNDNCNNEDTWWSVAGVDFANRDGVMFRKSTVQEGQLDWITKRGLGLEDSEWMVLKYPEGWDNWRDYWWTVGNHGDYALDATTLESDVIDVDYAGKKLTVPWGTRRLDDIMRKMTKKPGLAWIYILNDSRQDSVMRSAQDGDKLAVFVIGETFYADTFDIVVSDPLDSDNIVIPIDRANEEGPITNNAQSGKLNWPRVTTNESGMDTITGSGRGLAADMRIDTLTKYLEKAPNAEWEIVFVDGVERADLKNGDKLKVTAENGDVKEYFIEVRDYRPSQNANLASITWPDISLNPQQKFIYGWQGDTIPGFFTLTTNYRVNLPSNTSTIPALFAKPEDVNASLAIDRATTYNGAVEDRTTTFTVTAEDDSVQLTYSVEFMKDMDTTYMQPNYAEPFASQFILKANVNNFLEICNPGNKELDLSYYMISTTQNADGSDPASVITSFMAADSTNWADRRYRKYIPGRKWVGYEQWALTPGVVDPNPDITVDAVVEPGGVFTIGCMYSDSHISSLENPADWDIFERLDVSILPFTGNYGTYPNNWNEPASDGPIQSAFGSTLYIYKILNDSVRNGLKPANDPDDFEMIEALGMADDGRWYIGGERTTQHDILTRKPDFIYPNPVAGSSFGTTPEDSEWIFGNNGGGEDLLMEAELGQHFFNASTDYMSTVKAVIYTVSPGYSLEETIAGIKTGTVVDVFLGNIYPADPGQSLTIIAAADGSELASDAAISNNDTLVVVSANGNNTTKYVLGVTDDGLSADATLTSDAYDVSENAEAGTGGVAGIPYGTTVKTVRDNVSAHEGAIITVVNEDDLYIPFKRLNYFNQYVDVTADYSVYFEVVAENTVDKILYQLQPEVGEDTAFITSYIYNIVQDQGAMIIRYVPAGTTMSTFLSNINVSPGATVKVLDKVGFERSSGTIAQDDRVIATSPSGEVNTVYYLSLLNGDMEQTVPSLAFITSSVYVIDQVAFMIDSVVEQTTIASFMANIVPATDASVVILDAAGNVKNSGELAQDDQVQVTSANGEISVVYNFGTFKTLISAASSLTDQIRLYPNPTRSSIEIEGLVPGARIQVYNTLGTMVRDMVSEGQHKMIALDEESKGLYFVVISNDDVPVASYKVIKE